MTTYRERRENRAERLAEWADKRETKGTASYERGREALGRIPFGQPILVGHHSEKSDRSYRNRATGAMERGFEDLKKAESMRSRARGIERQLDESIYSDDPDAIERLEERIAELEAKREKIKEHNKAMRKKGACDHPADCDCRTHYPRDCTKCPNHPFPAYHLANLSGNIKRQRDRLGQLKREAAAREAPVVDEVTKGEVTVRKTERRVEVEFPSRPDVEVRDGLKANGFRWDRVAGVWQVPASYARGVEYAESLVA